MHPVLWNIMVRWFLYYSYYKCHSFCVSELHNKKKHNRMEIVQTPTFLDTMTLLNKFGRHFITPYLLVKQFCWTYSSVLCLCFGMHIRKGISNTTTSAMRITRPRSNNPSSTIKMFTEAPRRKLILLIYRSTTRNVHVLYKERIIYNGGRVIKSSCLPIMRRVAVNLLNFIISEAVDRGVTNPGESVCEKPRDALDGEGIGNEQSEYSEWFGKI